MSNARYVQVNIGRNVGDTPMTSDRWERFIHDVAHAIILSSRDGVPHPFQRHMGTGAWIDEDGQRIEEESAHISVIIDIDAHALRIELKKLAERYDQDAIALIIGSELIEA